MGRKAKEQTEWNRELTWNVIFARLKMLSLNMFVWDGLPKGMRPEYIERLLFSRGKAVFFKDPDLGFLIMEAQAGGQINEYGEWVKIRPVARNGEQFEEFTAVGKEADCVLIRNNALYMATEQFIYWYTQKLVEVEMSLDSNIKIQKFPFFIQADDKNILTLKNIVKKIEEDLIAIYYDKGIKGAIEILPTNAPYVADKLADYRHDLWNEAESFLGIDNANTDKRERVQTAEVLSNNEFIEFNAEMMLQARVLACEEINAMFPGLNISVKLREVKTNVTVHPDDSGHSGE